jgi:D-alanyl-D-alanine carboxypeptidase (penicillin-binding protein 5/6)
MVSRRLRLLLVLAGALLAASSAFAASPQVGGRAYLVVNAATGETLLAHHARQKVPIASITKLMTVLVTLEHAKLNDVVTVGREAAEVGESSIYLRRGEQLTVRELVEAALIQSANDAAFALAEYVGHGSVDEFVDLMNAKARSLGLTDTHFANPDGLDQAGHYSSARDVTKLARVVMRNEFIRSVVRRRTAHITGRDLHTWNDLLATFPGVIGVKTGHTRGAGWSQVAAARGRSLTIYATLLGEPTRSQRNRDLTRLLVWGLAQYRVVPVVTPGRVYATARLPYGRRAVEIVARRRIVRVARIDRPLVERVVTREFVSLPLEKGQRLGEVRVFDGGKLIASEPLVAARAVAEPGLLGRVRWYATRTVEHMWDWFT